MRVAHFLVAVMVTIVGNCAAVSAIGDVNQENLRVDSGKGVNAFLRTIKTFQDDNGVSRDNVKDEDEPEEERAILDAFKNAPLKSLEELAGDFSSIRGAYKHIMEENIELFKLIAYGKWTPESMGAKLNIAKRVETKTTAELGHDPQYLLWYFYTRFWNERKAK
ncbi:hypothetical protein PHMEG_00020426 [Phytophthora megakarya]|uniref:RxLR effector protein n=1 Tax=Phytophthora megakarya TaxID=4795 RepID=A0A225VQ99_9STRA|nr:hypothetical protein PHMEG_00020426 [Phytophthora megakarya]